ncbi:MAG: WYL domain-containing transcriptional regulator [Pseudobutyrivibrio sp.]|nr:WYL domain-containing transcriptional regulator [Pseudobutyrivibrio sp.]MCF0187199.1 WYL domain-containing transcriptional regulator [Bacteroidaceae bacterium]
MANTSGQKVKLLYIIEYLAHNTDENHPATAGDIIDYLATKGLTCERKAIYRDIAALQEANYDIIKNGFGYYMASRTFELAELKLLADAVSASKFISERKSFELLKKLENLTSKYEARQLERSVIVPDRTKTDNDKIFYTIDTIYQCISDNTMLAFCYEEWNLKKEKVLRHDGQRYEVSPGFLIRNDENYYLVAYDKISKDIRHYRVDKIVSAEIVDKPRIGLKELAAISKEEYAASHISMFSGDKTTISIKCPARLCGVLLDKFGTDIAIRPLSDDFLQARINIAISPQLYGWLTGIGAVITAPEDAVSQYKAYLHKQLDLYN